MLSNKKTLVMLAGGVLLIIFLVLGGVFLFMKMNSGGSSGTDPSGSGSVFSPFGQGSGNQIQSSNGSSTPVLPTGTPIIVTNVPLLRKLSNSPVSAVMTGSVVDNDGTLTSFARFMERATAHVYETPLSEVRPPVKISNTTVPRIQEALWSGSGSTVVLRYYDESLENIATYLAKIVTKDKKEVAFHVETGTSTLATLEGGFLEDNIPQLTFSPDGASLFYLIQTNLGARGYIKNLSKQTGRLVFSSPLREIVATWDTSDTILLSTKPSANIPGYVMSLNITTGVVSNVLTEIPGVTARMNPAGNRIIFFSNRDGVPLLNQLNLTTKEVSGLELTTLPEKCVWSKKEHDVVYCAVPTSIPAQGYPDTWYRGEVSYSDIVWRLNLETGEQSIVVIPTKLAGEAIDAVQLTLSPEEDFLLFVDRQDGILWSAKLREPVVRASKAATSTATASTSPIKR